MNLARQIAAVKYENSHFHVIRSKYEQRLATLDWMRDELRKHDNSYRWDAPSRDSAVYIRQKVYNVQRKLNSANTYLIENIKRDRELAHTTRFVYWLLFPAHHVCAVDSSAPHDQLQSVQAIRGAL